MKFKLSFITTIIFAIISQMSLAAELSYTVQIENTSTQNQTNIPVTFGQVFLEGDIPPDHTFEGIINGGQKVALQTDKKATHPDGSLRHAIFSAIIPSINAGGSISLETKPIKGIYENNSPIELDRLLNADYDSTVLLSVEDNSGGGLYTASVKELLGRQPPIKWLEGPIATEWMVSGSFRNVETGEPHPHLAALFNIRFYLETGDIKLDVTVENNWTYVDNPQNFTYTAQITTNNEIKYSLEKLQHFHHARWRNESWNNQPPSVHISHDPTQLLKSKAVPNYSALLINNIDNQSIDKLQSTWLTEPQPRCMVGNYASNCNSDDERLRKYTLSRTGPMGHGLIQPYFATTGGRPDIGPLPGWTAMYILSQSKLMKEIMLTHGNQAGSFPIHYRNKETGSIINLETNPYFTEVPSMASRDPDTGSADLPKFCNSQNMERDCYTAYSADTAHTPSLSYVPYLITGDYYHLEEMLFWVNWAITAKTNPGYRGFGDGIFSRIFQDRGQAWQLRELARASAFVPDHSEYKAHLNTVLQNNLNNYATKYLQTPPNEYGAMIPNYSYPTSSPWMDDFFTWAVYHVTELGFTEAQELANWKGKFPVQRMGEGYDGNNYCWTFASAYHLLVAPAKDSPMFRTINEVYTATDGQTIPYGGAFNSFGLECGSSEQASKLSIKPNDMIGYSYATAGFPANMRPALASAVDSQTYGAEKAWNKFISRASKPDYRSDPTWAISPRQQLNTPPRPPSMLSVEIIAN